MSETLSEVVETLAQNNESFAAEAPVDFVLTIDVKASEAPSGDGGVRFGTNESCEAFVAQRLEQGALVVRIAANDLTSNLASLVEEAIEQVLANAGVPAPSIAPFWNDAADFETRLGHQLFRARAAGATGITLFFESLGASGSILSAQDSVTLHTLAERTRDAALFVVFDDAYCQVIGVRAPTPLTEMFARESAMVSVKRLAIEVVEVVHDIRPVHVEASPVSETDETTETSGAEAHDDEPETTRLVLPEIHEFSATAEEDAHDDTALIDHTMLPLRQSAGASTATDNDSWRNWVFALTAARGTCTLAAFERLFLQSYMPLTEAIEGGLHDPRAVAARDEFCASFERSYTEAFPRFAVTGKRPKLVLDVFDLASKAARAHGARSAHVVMVDSMRFDVGGTVRNSISTALERSASLTEETILFASLPSTTRRQLDTLARGVEALRGGSDDDLERGDDSLRGKSAEMIRRVRVGHRDLFRLDLIEANLQESQKNRNETAAYAGEIIAKHANELPPRTLLYVFGDHGFRLDHDGHVQQGGASPEEILVPAYAFLIGDFH